jgi:DNA polymerase III subunit delta
MIKYSEVLILLYILNGKDEFSLQEALEKIKNELGDKEMLAVNTCILDGQQIRLSQLLDACSSVPFLSSCRLVIVKGLLGRFEHKSVTEKRPARSKGKNNSAVEEWTGLAGYIKQMPPTTVLVLVDGEVKPGNRLMKSLSPLAKVKGFASLKDSDLNDWAQERIKGGGGEISPAALKLLVGLVGPDLWVMNSEIDKLLAYCSDRAITEDDVKQLTSYAREASIFSLVDAILEGRRSQAQQLLHRLLQDGASPSYILAMITRQLRLIVLAKDKGKKRSTSGMPSSLEAVSEFSLQKATKQAKEFTVERIKKAYDKLLEADLGIKTGKYEGDLALDLLVVELGRS